MFYLLLVFAQIFVSIFSNPPPIKTKKKHQKSGKIENFFESPNQSHMITQNRKQKTEIQYRKC
jgi:hypothetical protein